MSLILDFSGVPSVKALKVWQVSDVIRYVPIGDAKDLSKAEVKAYKDAGIGLGLVFESYAKRVLEGASAGAADAKHSLSAVKNLGITSPVVIHFAVDTEINDSASMAAVAAYFSGASKVLGVARTGGYGQASVMTHLFDKHLIGHGWQTTAWSYGVREQRANLFQTAEQKVIEGHAADVNTILRPADKSQFWYGDKPVVIKPKPPVKPPIPAVKPPVVPTGPLNGPEAKTAWPLATVWHPGHKVSGAVERYWLHELQRHLHVPLSEVYDPVTVTAVTSVQRKHRAWAKSGLVNGNTNFYWYRRITGHK